MITKVELDSLVEKYETVDFIKDDPVQFPHRFSSKKDIELAGFIASLFAYGNRKVFIKKLNELFDIMQMEPENFVLNFDEKILDGFGYRFAKDFDIIEIFSILKTLYKVDGGLSELFAYAKNIDNSKTLSEKKEYSDRFLQVVVDYFYSRVKRDVGQGFYHCIPNPANGGAMKRMWMYLRWMVRKGPVDLGVWDCLKPSELKIPLDVHVARMSREMNLLSRSGNDRKAVLELTNRLLVFDENDPVKYDFAIFGYSINKGK